jgi:Contractile injection system tape measure protein
MKHLIKKQVVELKLMTDRDMFSVQQKANHFYYKKILPALERALDALTDDEHIIRIDKLEIDLGGIEWEEGRQGFNIDTMHERINIGVKKAVQELRDNVYRQGARSKGIENIEQPIAVIACEQWLHYILHGYLPWNITDAGDAWRMRVMETLATDYYQVEALRNLINHNDEALNRIVNNHPVDFLVRLVAVLTAREQGALLQLIATLQKELLPNENKSVQSINNPPVEKSGLLWKMVLEKADTGSSAEAIIESIRYEPLFNTNERKIEVAEDKIVKNELEKLRELIIEPGIKGTGELIVSEEGVFAANVGLVLLHPFYKYLFEQAGYTKENKFIDRDSQERAIYLLHFIATGETTCEEHLLAVPKILCGYPLEYSPVLETELLEMEKTEAMDMMSAAIEQWTILKNTTADGLREGFLQRSGKMYTKNDNLCFAVEPHAIDVLLDHLPWNLSIVKLPWISELIKVEWR